MHISGLARAVIGASLAAVAAISAQTASADAADAVATKSRSGTFMDFLGQRNVGRSGPSAAVASAARSLAATGGTRVLSAADAVAASANGGLPLWTFKARSSRDGNVYQGAMVGTNPFNHPATTAVPAKIVPVIFHFNAITTAISTTTGGWTTVPGSYTANPVAPDNVCLSAPNNVPARLLRQSPLFNPASFNFGGVSLGDTQYIDAMQRANFYNANPAVASSYHLLFSPVNQLEAIEIDVPANEGAVAASALIDATFGTGPAGPGCGNLGLVDIAWFDQLVNTQIIPRLAVTSGVGPSNLPIFMLYNTVLGGSPAVGFGNCCIGGYHGSGGFPTPTQTYSVADFDTTGEFGTAFADTAVIAHELGEWANDPFGIDLVAPWGGTGQVAGCQGNLEVGDPLTGTLVPPVKGQNGFSYDLQELVFFSWFLGAPSTGINGWYSLNGSFTTDAGTPCALQ